MNILGFREQARSLFDPCSADSACVCCRMEVSCLELALEGERLCKVGDFRAGVSFFEAAIQVGTEDLQVLSAIYSQLGNAYFHLHDYAKALEFHRHDLTLTRLDLHAKPPKLAMYHYAIPMLIQCTLHRTIGDLLGEAKASGNLGNTLKVLGRFDEAVVCCQRQLDIATDINDKVSGRSVDHAEHSADQTWPSSVTQISPICVRWVRRGLCITLGTCITPKARASAGAELSLETSRRRSWWP